MSKHTQRTLKGLQDKGYLTDICERWILNPRHPAGGVRRDLFWFLDIIAIRDNDILGVQSCGTAFSQHRHKILGECRSAAWAWLKAGGKIELWGWRKLKVKRGGKAVRWTPRIEEITGVTLIEYAKKKVNNGGS